MLPPKVFTSHFEATNDFTQRELLVHNRIVKFVTAVNCSFSDTFAGNIYFAGDGTRVT